MPVSLRDAGRRAAMSNILKVAPLPTRQHLEPGMVLIDFLCSSILNRFNAGDDSQIEII